MSLILKICTSEEWASAERNEYFDGSPVDLADGYIHFSTPAQVSETAAKHFKGKENLLLIAFESEAFSTDLKWEPARNGELFPHLYARLPVAAALWKEALHLDEKGVPVVPPIADQDT